MPEEVGVILDNLISIKSSRFGDLELFSGELMINKFNKIIVTTGWSGWGKVSSARATTRLLSTKYNDLPVELAIFTGVAGAIDKKLRQWDLIIAESLIQHDMDARPIFEKFVIPALNKKKIFSNKIITDNVFDSLNKKLKEEKLNKFGKIFKGLIATGDKFISDKKIIEKLSDEIPGILAVEMEGASFAQVAHQENIDWIVLRVISDSANEEAPEDFNQFLNEYKLRSFELLKYFLSSFF